MQIENTQQGFTFIELLVVVLIIGILAAVALPQYQLTIGKTRASEILAVVSAIKNAQELYYLANGEYAIEITQLDVEWPAGGTIARNIHGDETYSYSNGNVYRVNTQGKVIGSNSKAAQIEIVLDHATPTFPGYTRMCVADPGAFGNKVCNALGTGFIMKSAGHNYYSL